MGEAEVLMLPAAESKRAKEPNIWAQKTTPMNYIRYRRKSAIFIFENYLE